MKPSNNYNKQAIIILFLGVLLYLIIQVSIAYGVLKERESRICLTPNEVSSWQSVINIAEGIYLNVSKDYQTNLEILEGSVKYWRGSSLWNADQLASCQEGNELLQGQLFNDTDNRKTN